MKTLPPEREVDCDCDIALHRPVYRDHTGINERVTACLRCGAVTFTQSQVDEPNPGNTICVGNTVLPLPDYCRDWLASFPRRAESDRSVSPSWLPASLRCPGVDELARAEQDAILSQKSLTLRERLVRAAFPDTPPPDSLPEPLHVFTEVWRGFHELEHADVEIILQTFGSGSGAAPFALELLISRPALADDTARWLRSTRGDLRLAALRLVGVQRLLSPAILATLESMVRAAPRVQPRLASESPFPLLDTLFLLGTEIAALRPELENWARRIGNNDDMLQWHVRRILARLPDSD